MKTLYFALALATLLLTDCARRDRPGKTPVVETVRTEDSPTPPTAARDLADVMASTLSLPPEQTPQVRQILNKLTTDANAARQKYPANSPQLNAELKRLVTASEASLKQVLGPVKYKESLVKRKQMQAEMQQRAK
jgi:hypothetical protein